MKHGSNRQTPFITPFFISYFYAFLTSFANALIDVLKRRVIPAIEQDHLSTLEVFDASSLVKLFTGKRNSIGEIQYDLEEGEIEEYGVKESALLLKSASKLPHIKEYGLNFDHRMR